MQKDNLNIFADLGEIYSRLIDQKAFLQGQINFMLQEFEVGVAYFCVLNLSECLSVLISQLAGSPYTKFGYITK